MRISDIESGFVVLYNSSIYNTCAVYNIFALSALLVCYKCNRDTVQPTSCTTDVTFMQAVCGEQCRPRCTIRF